MQGDAGRGNGANANNVGSGVKAGDTGSRDGSRMNVGNVGSRAKCCLGLPSLPVLAGTSRAAGLRDCSGSASSSLCQPTPAEVPAATVSAPAPHLVPGLPASQQAALETG